jgi:hypothetical protein
VSRELDQPDVVPEELNKQRERRKGRRPGFDVGLPIGDCASHVFDVIPNRPNVEHVQRSVVVPIKLAPAIS